MNTSTRKTGTHTQLVIPTKIQKPISIQFIFSSPLIPLSVLRVPNRIAAEQPKKAGFRFQRRRWDRIKIKPLLSTRPAEITGLHCFHGMTIYQISDKPPTNLLNGTDGVKPRQHRKIATVPADINFLARRRLTHILISSPRTLKSHSSGALVLSLPRSAKI